MSTKKQLSCESLDDFQTVQKTNTIIPYTKKEPNKKIQQSQSKFNALATQKMTLSFKGSFQSALAQNSETNEDQQITQQSKKLAHNFRSPGRVDDEQDYSKPQ